MPDEGKPEGVMALSWRTWRLGHGPPTTAHFPGSLNRPDLSALRPTHKCGWKSTLTGITFIPRWCKAEDLLQTLINDPAFRMTVGLPTVQSLVGVGYRRMSLDVQTHPAKHGTIVSCGASTHDHYQI